VVIVLSMPVVGPLLVSAPVGGGEAHAAVHRPVSTGKLSPPTRFSPLQHQGVSPLQHPSLSFPSSPSNPSPQIPTLDERFVKKKEISGSGAENKLAREWLDQTVTRPISDFWSPKGGHNDVSEYESLINISLNAVFPLLPDNPDRAHSLLYILGTRTGVKSWWVS
jgi:hypothetical protein